MSDKMTIMMYSGTVDKLLPLAIVTSGAVSMDMEVNIFVTFYGLLGFKKGMVETNQKFIKDFEEFVPMIKEQLKKKNIPSWYDMLKKAKETGKVRIQACSTACDMLDIKKGDLDPIVDEVVGVGTYLAEASESKVTLMM
ncbi:MAG TPA: DsrE/DsrF/DrsH-like family protein [Terriglobales bacterium]|nr:DsrE/DsrF/DrsH-like family protein [Terriglobales bacterium]